MPAPRSVASRPNRNPQFTTASADEFEYEMLFILHFHRPAQPYALLRRSLDPCISQLPPTTTVWYLKTARMNYTITIIIADILFILIRCSFYFVKFVVVDCR